MPKWVWHPETCYGGAEEVSIGFSCGSGSDGFVQVGSVPFHAEA